jgi:hypothetical protein
MSAVQHTFLGLVSSVISKPILTQTDDNVVVIDSDGQTTTYRIVIFWKEHIAKRTLHLFWWLENNMWPFLWSHLPKACSKYYIVREIHEVVFVGHPAFFIPKDYAFMIDDYRIHLALHYLMCNHLFIKAEEVFS